MKHTAKPAPGRRAFSHRSLPAEPASQWAAAAHAQPAATPIGTAAQLTTQRRDHQPIGPMV